MARANALAAGVKEICTSLMQTSTTMGGEEGGLGWGWGKVGWGRGWGKGGVGEGGNLFGQMGCGVLCRQLEGKILTCKQPSHPRFCSRCVGQGPGMHQSSGVCSAVLS